eukprot:14327714-Heterocapsa_arctica.AAC.1
MDDRAKISGFSGNDTEVRHSNYRKLLVEPASFSHSFLASKMNNIDFVGIIKNKISSAGMQMKGVRSMGGLLFAMSPTKMVAERSTICPVMTEFVT